MTERNSLMLSHQMIASLHCQLLIRASNASLLGAVSTVFPHVKDILIREGVRMGETVDNCHVHKAHMQDFPTLVKAGAPPSSCNGSNVNGACRASALVIGLTHERTWLQLAGPWSSRLLNYNKMNNKVNKTILKAANRPPE
mmetsp:Transcript_40490/g.49104  ORF Transcript_40490/g.49104 Transcript_40490/m.49104 type:complete len:141 (-) Transcript_40490:67-489(-)